MFVTRKKYETVKRLLVEDVEFWQRRAIDYRNRLAAEKKKLAELQERNKRMSDKLYAIEGALNDEDNC